MLNIAIIGGTGGIGAALVHYYAQRFPHATIWASHRLAAGQAVSNVQWVPLDLTADESINNFANQLSAQTDALDLLLICSGWLHDAEHMPEKSLRDLTGNAFGRALRINATAPMLLTAELSNLLTRRPATGADRPQSSRARIVALSAKVGSISDNSLGGWHAYRMSKAALNMGVRNLGIEFQRNKRKPIVCAVHPGTTHSALSAPFAKRGLRVVAANDTAERLGQFVANMTDAHQGGLFHWDGSDIPW